MHRRRNTVLSSTAIITLTLALAAAPSSAATSATWTVKPGGSVTAQGTIWVTDPKTTARNMCPSATFTGTLKEGKGLPGTGIGSIDKTTLANCGYGFALPLTAHGLPWKLNALSYNSTNGTTTGSLTGIDLTGIGPGCQLALDGSAAGADDGVTKLTYTNSTGKLKFLSSGGNLHFYHVSGCFGIFNNGDPAKITQSFQLSPKQVVSSP